MAVLIPGAGLVDLTGTVIIPGAGVVEQAGGATTHSGSGTLTLPLLTASGAAKRGLEGSGQLTLPLLDVTGAGKKERKGSGVVTLPSLDVTGAGKKERKGSGAVSLPLLTAAGAGTASATGVWTGSGALTLPVLTASGAAKRALGGSGQLSLPLLSVAATGKRALLGSGALTLPSLSVVGSGPSAPATTQESSGGWPAYNRTDAARRRWRREEEEELERLLHRNERLRAAEATVERALEAAGEALPETVAKASATDLARLRGLTERYAAITERDLLARRAQRALDYAQRAQTQLAYELALRELARAIEEEELAVLMVIAAAA